MDPRDPSAVINRSGIVANEELHAAYDRWVARLHSEGLVDLHGSFLEPVPRLAMVGWVFALTHLVNGAMTWMADLAPADSRANEQNEARVRELASLYRLGEMGRGVPPAAPKEDQGP